MFRKANKTFKIFSACLGVCLLSAGFAHAEEITVIDFEGKVLGKVIPDGTAVNFNNEVIGNITADSLIIDEKGALVGGVVPQGVAIGTDNKLLGKINADGLIRSTSGQVVGKALPNGLVISENQEILGAVLYPGLIYNDEGQTVGRLAGDGSFVNLEGQNIGFVSAQGYAYRRSGEIYTLEGRLISSKMVISLDGSFLGSVAPGGRATDFEGNEIGRLHANGYIYDSTGAVIGAVVAEGYAFDNAGKYLGIISYDGRVLNENNVVGHLRADDKIVDAKSNVIGFRLDFSSTATDLKGAFLGNLLPHGQVVFGGKTVGLVAPKGMVQNADGEIIGRMVEAGPAFDYLGHLIGQISRNGKVSSITGSPLGYAKGNIAYDTIGRPLGATFRKQIVFNGRGELLGLNGISSDFKMKGEHYTITPEGYVYMIDGALVSRSLELGGAYKQDGALQSYIGVNGALQGAQTQEDLKLTPTGLILNDKNQPEATLLKALFAVSENGEKIGLLQQDNGIVDNLGALIAKILPAQKVVSVMADVQTNLMPIIGSAYNLGAVLGINGNAIGSLDVLGTVRDFSGNIIGQVLTNGVVADSKKATIGFLADSAAVVDNSCTFLGVVSNKGDVRNTRDVVLGRRLANGQVISETGGVMGHTVPTGVVYDDSGNPLGAVSPLGEVINYAGEKQGCLTQSGKFLSDENIWIGSLAEAFPVIDFENYIIGRALTNNRVVDEQSAEIGFIQPDGTYISDQDGVSGLIFKYQIAFDLNNKYMGRIAENGNVVSDENKVLGKVKYTGQVVFENKPIGYALYDLYIYDENGNAIGYLLGNGNVVNFSGVQIGKVDRGFLVSGNKLIGRGARDYQVRGTENRVIGEINLNGNVINKAGEVIGTVTGSGEIRNPEGDILGAAYPLQYYNINEPEEQKPANWATPHAVGALTPADDGFEGKDYGLKTIGIALTPDGNYLGDILEDNSVVDKLGNLLGTLNDGLITDNDGNLIGMEEVKEPDGQQMFVPAGTFGDGGAYGIGNTPTNLGPGGGFGPGERYDPVRSAALAAAQAQRRTNIAVGQLSSNVDRRSFDGMQDNWDGVTRKLSTWRVDMSEMILADKPIPAVLARTIMSSDGADDVPVTAIVERNVYAEEGRNIVIPAGSRVMGEASGMGSGGTSGGAVRVNITWTRLIRPDGSAFEFSAAKTGDAQGRGGALAYLDEQLLKRYTLPIVTSLLSSGLAYITATNDNGTSAGESSLESSRQQAANDARQQFLQNMDQIFQQILQDKTNIQAVTYVPAGTRLIIYPKEDLWIRTMERSEQEERDKNNTGGKGPLIDGKEGDESGSSPASGGLTGTGGSSGSASKSVVYLDEDVNAKPTGGGLIEDTNTPQAQRRTPNIPAVTVTGATPPPPSSSGMSVPPSASTTRQNTSGAQLF